MKLLLALAALAFLGACARQMEIDPAQMGKAQARLQIEAPDLTGYISIPLLNEKVVKVTLFRFAGCVDAEEASDSRTEIGTATLSPSENRQSVTIPAGVELAIEGASVEYAGGNSWACRRALRFMSEADSSYVLRFTPHPSFQFKPYWELSCGMVLRELHQGAEVPVATAHHAILVNKGFWEGRRLDLCARSKSQKTAP